MAKQLSAEHKARIKEGMRLARERKLAQAIEPSKITINKVTTTMPTNQTPQVPDAFQALLGSISDQVTKQIDETVTGEFKELRKQAQQNAKLDVTINGNVNQVSGVRHGQLDQIIKIAALRQPILMVGMAGTGKTMAAEQVAEALGLEFAAMSVGAQTSKSDIAGFMNANGSYTQTLYREAFEHGKVFLMDEIDAGNANVLIQVNAALSNGYMAFPDKMVKKHPNFVFIASANTYGTGMNRQYVGRNQLDAATLDRFTIVDWDIDGALEETMAIGTDGRAWLEAVRTVRYYVNKHNIRALITPRATFKGSQLLQAGFKVKEVVPQVLLGSVPEDKKKEITTLAVEAFNKES